MAERMDFYDGCTAEWWLGVGENKEGKRYCRNCGWSSDIKMFDPYMENYEQWLPKYCPRCGFRNRVVTKEEGEEIFNRALCGEVDEDGNEVV